MISKKLLRILLVLSLIIMFAGTNAFAIDYSQHQGQLGLQGGVYFNTTSLPSSMGGGTFTNTTYIVNANGGYFIIPEIELGAAVMTAITSTSQTGSASTNNGNFSINFTPTYNLWVKNSPVAIYIGPQIGFMDFESSSSGTNQTYSEFSYGALAGLNYFVSENTSVNLEVNWLGYSFKPVGSGTSLTTNIISVLVGAKYFL